MKQGHNLFVAATAAEAKAKAARGNGERSFGTLRITLAGQALVGLGVWTPYPESWTFSEEPSHADRLRWRAEWAVAQADAMLVALGLVAEES